MIKSVENSTDLQGMREAGRLASKLLYEISKLVKPGISTQDINDFAEDYTKKAGAISAPLGYKFHETDPPFPKSICTSVNNVVAHGIPDKTCILKDGDIINCDVTVKLPYGNAHYHGDTSRTFFVGRVPSSTKKLVQRTEKAMYEGIRAIKPGACISKIGENIETYIKPYGYGIVKELSGHGIGKSFHQEPTVFHFKNKSFSCELVPGMVITVEPMINEGSPDITLLSDNWTIITTDGSLSAQFEHTILVTDRGYEILTKNVN